MLWRRSESMSAEQGQENIFDWLCEILPECDWLNKFFAYIASEVRAGTLSLTLPRLHKNLFHVTVS